jgi:hypothetical protein
MGSTTDRAGTVGSASSGAGAPSRFSYYVEAPNSIDDERRLERKARKHKKRSAAEMPQLRKETETMAQPKHQTETDEGWEDVTTGGLGEQIDWKDGPFTGTYLGPISATDKEGEVLEAFAFSKDGSEYFAWSSYQLKSALDLVAVGNTIRIEFLGKKELDSGRSVNMFRVQQRVGGTVKKAAVKAAVSQPVTDDEPF